MRFAKEKMVLLFLLGCDNTSRKRTKTRFQLNFFFRNLIFQRLNTADVNFRLQTKKVWTAKRTFHGYFNNTFVTVIKSDEYKWEEVIPVVKKLIQSFIDNGIEFIHQKNTGNLPEIEEQEETEVIRRIKQLLDDNIRPAVAMDGGDVVFDSFIEGVVKLKLQGSCSGCPSSTMTLKMGIEGLLTRMVPEVQSVEAVDA